MAGAAGGRPPVGPKGHKVGRNYQTDSHSPELKVTAGGILTPVIGFRGPGVTGKPPAPEHRGFPKEPGDGNLPGGKRKAGGNNALKAFGINGSGQNN